MPRFPHVVARIAALLVAAEANAAASDAVTAAAWQRLQSRSAETIAALNRTAPEITAADSAAAEAISFSEFLAPAGEGGLEYSARLRSLAGKRVRLTGYLVRQAKILPGLVVLSPVPVTVEPGGLCFAAEIPSHAVYVHAPRAQAEVRTAYRPGRVVFTGILELGSQREIDGRNSALRLRLVDPPTTAAEPSPRAAISQYGPGS